MTDWSSTHRIEEYDWDPFGLVKRFRLRQETVIGNTAEGCEADASNAPLTEWQYRFNPLSEREQKRQYRTSGPQEYYGLAWVYYQLGVDNKTLTTFNGIEGSFCGSPASTVSLWPVEYNTYGPMNTRIITRPDNTREYVATDHLGSSRAIVSGAGAILQRTDYEAFGGGRTSEGEGARTTYIGREEDQESGLGFYGVRLYEPEYGRFTSVDAMADVPTQIRLTPFHYTGNNPIYWTDPDGRCPWCLVWAAVEVGLAVYDAYATGTTIIDPKASTSEKIVAATGFVLGAILPGGGYGTAAKQTAKTVDKVVDAGKAVDKANDVQKAIGPAGDAGAQVTKQIPEGWTQTTTKKGDGTLFKDPQNPGGNNVRVQTGKPNSPNPAQQKPYVKHTKDGKVLNVKGN